MPIFSHLFILTRAKEFLTEQVKMDLKMKFLKDRRIIKRNSNPLAKMFLKSICKE
jgi:hypothetical protein